MKLTLAQLEAFDPEAPPARGTERRFCCPSPVEPCAGKPVDAAHRSLCLNVQTGAWCCNRCHAAGVLEERQEPRERRSQWRQAFAVPAAKETPKVTDTAWREELKGVERLAGGAGGAYLGARGIPVDLAHAAGVRFSMLWYGRRALLFPVRNRAGELVATAGRYVDGRKPKTRDAGQKSSGVFATPGAWEAEPLVLVEGPIDALSLAAAGYPSIALLGCNLPEALAWDCARARVAVALDADEAGDAAAAKLMTALGTRGAQVFRLRPADGKDWNDMLLSYGVEVLREKVAAALEIVPDALQSKSDASSEVAGVLGPSGRTAEEYAALRGEVSPEWEEMRGIMARALPDADLLDWLQTSYGCRLYLDACGKLRIENGWVVEDTVKAEVRRRQGALVCLLARLDIPTEKA